MKPRLLVDTDPGVDDALAILMAARHGTLEALSVAAGNTGLSHTVRNACTLVDLLGLKVPVFSGCREPLVRAPREDAMHVHGKDGFGDVGLPQPTHAAANEHAARALVRLTRDHPGELTLVALAPLTNLALALRLDADLPSRVKRLVVMGGAVTARGNMARPPVEFNVGFDPEAAHVVFSSFPEFDLVDWELATRHGFDDRQFDDWLARGDDWAGFFGRICATSRRYNASQGRHGVVAADALAMAVALGPDIVLRSETRPVAVELDGSATRGMSVVDWSGRTGQTANARIAMQLDQERFAGLVAAALGAAG